MLTLQAPAKINLFLRVLSKRGDGYHELASLFQTIDIFDQLTLQLTPEDKFTCSKPELENSDNLVMKALDLFRKKSGKSFGLACHLVKNIPMQAGLGGGSSDAAQMLKGLNQLLSYPFEDTDLLELARELGSDVPFFLTGGAAYCEGRGDIVKKIKSLENKTLWIIKPPVGVSTPVVYQKLDLSKLVERNPKLSLQDHLLSKGEYYNDLEEAAFAAEPSLRGVKENLLAQNFATVTLSGSGSAFFCIGDVYPTVPKDYYIRRCNYL